MWSLYSHPSTRHPSSHVFLITIMTSLPMHVLRRPSLSLHHSEVLCVTAVLVDVLVKYRDQVGWGYLIQGRLLHVVGLTLVHRAQWFSSSDSPRLNI